MEVKTIDEIASFKKDFDAGFSDEPKHISSKYFYDALGDELFQKIMNMEEYYLTNAEFEIFSKQKEALLERISPNGEAFNLIELGAGDGTKTKILLKHFLESSADFTYHPVDISSNILAELAIALQEELPTLNFKTINLEYFSAIAELERSKGRKNVILFLGSNIGNFQVDQVRDFLAKLKENCLPGDQFLLGVDLKKDPDRILAAYDDPHGITAEFNLNLLHRANRELGANFKVDKFKHYASYNPENGEARSYIIAKEEMDVEVKALSKCFHFKANEYIHTEISKKYDLQELEDLAAEFSFEIKEHFTDSNKDFVNSLWELKY